MKLFRDLKPKEELKFRKWAWDNYKPFHPINGVWHPVVQDECRKMNADAEWDAKIADQIDGYDRDDLGESPDY